MKWGNYPCFFFILKTMQTSLPTKTRLGQQTVCQKTNDEKLHKKQSEYFYISQQIFLHIITHKKANQDHSNLVSITYLQDGIQVATYSPKT